MSGFILGDVWPLTSEEGVELGIHVIAAAPARRWKPYFADIYNPQTEAPISLPFVAFLYGAKPA